MQCADWIGWNCGNEGHVTPEGEKRLCSPKCRTDGVFLLLLMLLKFFCVINAYKMFLCIFFYLLLSQFFWVFSYGLGSSNVERLGL